MGSYRGPGGRVLGEELPIDGVHPFKSVLIQIAKIHPATDGVFQKKRGQLPVSMCLGWHIGHYAYLMDKLKKTPEGAGNALDNSSLVFMPEAGHGLQLNDGVSNFQTHSVDRMVLLLGGRAGGLMPGRHIIAPDGTHPGNVLISAMQAAGYTSDTFGQVTGGKFAEVFG